MALIPPVVLNWLHAQETKARSGESFEKIDPVRGRLLCRVARSAAADVGDAVEAAKRAQTAWADIPAVKRGDVLHDLVMKLGEHREQCAQIVAAETGKSHVSALAETDGAVRLGLFMAGEGQRLYGRTTTSGTPHRHALTVRQPLGVAGLIVPANTPIANVAWKVFPALICGNAVVLKAAEDAPATAWFFGRLAHDIGMPPGVLNVIQGYGEEAGGPLVEHTDVAVVSFTGSTAVGRRIAAVAGQRLARVSLELGGKNPLVVCDDANLSKASEWSLLSAFSNAGQRCASASRIIIFDSVYERFREMLVEGTKQLKVGPEDGDDLGPVINGRQLSSMLGYVEQVRARGGRILVGGHRLETPQHRDGFYMAPTLIEGVGPQDEASTTEIFGPVACLYRARGFEEALALANDSPYGLTACVHTRSLHRAVTFAERVRSGVVVINAGTFGSEPHMPFGGVKQSGNGSREPGTEALDVYSNLKDVYVSVDPGEV